MIGRKVYYEGKVQGVGFRWTIKNIAKGYEVIGWVRNLADGRVELQVSGVPDEVVAFLKAIEQSELGSHIGAVHEHAIPELHDSKGFEILP